MGTPRQITGEDRGPFVWCVAGEEDVPCYSPECREHGCMAETYSEAGDGFDDEEPKPDVGTTK